MRTGFSAVEIRGEELGSIGGDLEELVVFFSSMVIVRRETKGRVITVVIILVGAYS